MIHIVIIGRIFSLLWLFISWYLHYNIRAIFMIVEECKIYKGFVAVLLLIILFSCTDETMISGNVEGAYISIRNIDSQNTTHSGSEEDYDVNIHVVVLFATRMSRILRIYIPNRNIGSFHITANHCLIRTWEKDYQ